MAQAPKTRTSYSARGAESVRSHALGHAPAVAAIGKQYFGIDLARISEMSDGELAAIADRAREMERVKEILPILEKHFKTLVEGQLAYEQFISQSLKEVEKAGKQVDKLMLDAWLLNRGYTLHQKEMNQRAGLEAAKQDASFASTIDLNNLDFNAAIKIAQLKHRQRAAQIGEKVPEFERGQRAAEALRQETQRRKELLTYGTRGRSGKGFGARARQLFSI